MRRTSPCRVLDDKDLPDVRALLARDPVANVFVAGRVEAAGLDPWRLGAELWGYATADGLAGVCFAGANLVPVGCSPAALTAFADRARRLGRRCSSIVGDAEQVLPLWRTLSASWGPPREVRPDQPLLALSAPPLVLPDPLVRRAALADLDVVFPAAVEMFTEEVGVSPVEADGGLLYRSRIAELILAGRSFLRTEGDQVVFKAELGAVSRSNAQIQGVWVHPDWRGKGLGTAGTAAVAAFALGDGVSSVSLYVNSYNTPARAAYARVGFRQIGTFASILF